MTIRKIINYAWIIVALLCAIVIFSLYTVHRSNARIDQVQEIREHSMILVNELRESSQNLTNAVRSFAVTGAESYATQYMNVVRIRAGEMARPMDRTIAPGQRVALTDLMQQAGFTASELALLQESSDLSNALIELETEAMNAVRGLFQDPQGNFTIQGQPDKARAADLVFSDAYNAEVVKIMTPFSAFAEELDLRLNQDLDAANQKYANSMRLLQASIIVLAAIFVLLLFLMDRLMVRPVLECNRFATDVAGGNLNSQLNVVVHNEIGSLAASLHSMVASLRERITFAETATSQAEAESRRAAKAVQEAEDAKQAAEAAKSLGMRQAGEQLLTIVETMRQVAGNLSVHVSRAGQSAADQKQRLHDSAQSMEQLNQSVLEIANSAGQTTDSANETQHNAIEGAGIVTQVIQSISVVDDKSRDLQDSMQQLGERAEGISRILDVISDIADQTNLLALNAAIEAARAGEAGRGFAVVADEVRKLAEKTMQATSEVGSAVRAIQNSTQDNMQGMENASAAVATSTDLAGAAGTSLQRIVDIAKGTADKVRSIAVAADQQSSTCEEIAATTESINGLAEQTMGVMHDANEAVQALDQALQRLLALTEELRSA